MQCLTPIRTWPGLNSTPQDSQQRGGISSYPRRVRRSLATAVIVGIGTDGTVESKTGQAHGSSGSTPPSSRSMTRSKSYWSKSLSTPTLIPRGSSSLQ